MNVPGGVARNNVSVVLLPDGKVFVCGGTADPSAPCAMFDPEEDSLAQMAPEHCGKDLPVAPVVGGGGVDQGFEGRG